MLSGFFGGLSDLLLEVVGDEVDEELSGWEPSKTTRTVRIHLIWYLVVTCAASFAPKSRRNRVASESSSTPNCTTSSEMLCDSTASMGATCVRML